MANKRDLKKSINYICSDLFSECAAMALYGNKKDEDVKVLLSSILFIHSNYVNRISHVEPGMKPKAYFEDLKAKFSTQVDELIDNIANL